MTADLEARLSTALNYRPTTQSRRLIDERVAATIDAEALRRGARPRLSGLRRRFVRPLLLAAVLSLLAAGGWTVIGMPSLGPNVMTAPNTAEQFDAEVAAAMQATVCWRHDCMGTNRLVMAALNGDVDSGWRAAA